MSEYPKFTAWLEDTLNFYRSVGFFQQSAEETPELARQLLPQILDDPKVLGEDRAPTEPIWDLTVLACDKERVLFDKLTQDIGPDQKFYAILLPLLAAISRGRFRPQQIQESWPDDQAEIRIDFRQDGSPCTIFAARDGREVDTQIFPQLNLLLLGSPYRFELVEVDDNLLVTVLTAEEWRRIESERQLGLGVYDLNRLLEPLDDEAPCEAPEEGSETFSGTLNEYLDLCVGRLQVTIEHGQATCRHRFEGSAHSEELDFVGQEKQGQIAGTMTGTISMQGDKRPYRGVWLGRLSPGRQVLLATWKGWFEDQGESEPADRSLVQLGQWAAISTSRLARDDAYTKRIRAWLENVWVARDPSQYQWNLP